MIPSDIAPETNRRPMLAPVGFGLGLTAGFGVAAGLASVLPPLAASLLAGALALALAGLVRPPARRGSDPRGGVVGRIQRPDPVAAGTLPVWRSCRTVSPGPDTDADGRGTLSA